MKAIEAGSHFVYKVAPRKVDAISLFTRDEHAGSLLHILTTHQASALVAEKPETFYTG